MLRKIVEHAADSVPGTLRNERRLAGIDVGEAGASARVTVANHIGDVVSDLRGLPSMVPYGMEILAMTVAPS